MYDLVVEGNVVDLEQITRCQIGISNGIIQKVVKQGIKGEEHLEVGNCLIFPGFIDIHTHLRDPGWTHKEDFTTGTKAAIHGGITTVVDMPNLPDPTTNMDKILEKKNLSSEKGLIDVALYAGVTQNNMYSLKDMAEQIVGYKIYTSESTGNLYLPYTYIQKAAENIGETGKPLSIHAEDQFINELHAKELDGRMDAQVHCDARPPESEIMMVKKIIKLGIQANFCHISTPEAVDLIHNEKRRGKQVYSESTLHHLFFNRNAVNDTRLKVNPPLRDKARQMGLLYRFVKGKVDFLVTDHSPHTVEEKNEGVWEAPSGTTGLDDYGRVVSWLIVKRGMDPKHILRVSSLNPAKFMGLKNRGRVVIGNRADLTILDVKHTIKTRSNRLYTKCGWSPYEGIEFPGTVRNTVVEGKILSEYDEVFA